MKKDFTSINVILDKSGSMGPLTDDTIGGFNKFLDEQKLVPGEATLSLCAFNEECTFVYDWVPLSSIQPLDDEKYSPKGNTALLDAIGVTIDKVGNKLSAMKEDERPSKVLFLIITDGQENASHLKKQYDMNFREASFKVNMNELQYPLNRIKEMIKHQKEKYNWSFIFLGANLDAIKGGNSLGTITHQYSPSTSGTAKLYNQISDATTTYRSGSSFTIK